MTKTTEIIDKYADTIREAMIDAYKETLDHPNWQIKLYIWESGKIDRLEGQAGDNFELSSKDPEVFGELYKLTTIKGFDVFGELWDDGPIPEDEDTRNAFLEWAVSDYCERIDDELALVRANWQQTEDFNERYC